MIDIFKYFTINGAQVIYPNYALLVFLTSAIFLVVGVSFAKFLDNTFPKFEEQKEEDDSENVPQKHKVQLLIEVIIQIGIIAVFSYILREVIINFIYLIFGKKNVIGKPDKYAILIVAPTMFSQQKSLINKITYLWN